MAALNPPPVRLAFGPFEVRPAAGELLKGGIRIRLSGQPFAILLVLLKHPGEAVTREQLREEIWSQGTFVDFEHGLNAAINKLRRALSDSAEDPRYIETIPGRGYRFIGTLNSGHEAPVLQIARPEPGEERSRRWRSVPIWERFLWAAAVIICAAFSLRFHSAPQPLTNAVITRITADAGLSTFPSLSPDGNLLAYSSDNGLEGQQDLYVRHVGGGQPIRLTFDGAGNTAPDFSQDGARIVFQSNRNGGGIYDIPALGGEPRLLARGGSNPKYSPDGTMVAYWVGTTAIDARVPGNGTVWVVPVMGGAPRRVGAGFSSARTPIWLPEGNRLLMVGYASSRAYEGAAIDWWVVPTDGGAAVKTGFFDALQRSGVLPALIPPPGCWSAPANKVTFSLASREQSDLWEVGISSRTGKVNGTPERSTAGTLSELYPSCSHGGTLAFTGLESTRDVWSFTFDLNHGASASNGRLERVTSGPSWREYASIAHDGSIVAFASSQLGRDNIWIRNLTTGKESPVTTSSLEQRFPVTSDAGDRIAFSVFGKDRRDVYVALPGGPAERVCEDCLRATDWSRDGKTILIFRGDPYEVDTIEVASHQRRAILKDSKYNLLYARFAPDNRWVSFTVRTQANRAKIVVAPLEKPNPIPESEWITITESGAGDWADWSPDGNTLYFSSARDGHECFWGQRIDAFSRRPVGEPFPVLHLHGRLYLHAGSNWGGWSAGGGRLAMVLAEDTGNIWMMSRGTVNGR